MGYPLILPASSTSNGISLSKHRQRLGRELGLFGRGTIDSFSQGLEAERYAVATNFMSDFTRADHYDGLYLYVTSGSQAGTQRKLVNGSFDGPNGAFMVDYPFDAVLPAGSGIEIAVLPAVEYLGVGGLNDCLNLGLETLPAIHKIALTSDGTKRASLANYPWPIKGVQAVYRPLNASDDCLRPMAGWTFENDAEAPYIQLPCAFAADTAFTVELLRPATTWIGSDFVWGDSTTGLADESDECLYDLNSVYRAAKPIALDRMAQLFPRGSKERVEIKNEADGERVSAAISRFYGRFRGNGAQRVGAVGRR